MGPPPASRRGCRGGASAASAASRSIALYRYANPHAVSILRGGFCCFSSFCHPFWPRAQWRAIDLPGFIPGKSMQCKGVPKQSADCMGQQPHGTSVPRAEWRVTICPGSSRAKSMQCKGVPKQSADCMGQQPHGTSVPRAEWRVTICPGSSRANLCNAKGSPSSPQTAWGSSPTALLCRAPSGA